MSGFRTKLQTLAKEIALQNYPVILLAESWLSDDISDAEITLFIEVIEICKLQGKN